MKGIGFSSGVVGRESNVDRMVKAVLEKTGGSGGGSRELAQGRTELSKLIKLIRKG